MSKVELIKSIEAIKLNPRSGLPLKEPPVTVPYAAILENLTTERELYRFHYLGELYQCPQSVMGSAIRPLGEPEPAPRKAQPAAPPTTQPAAAPAEEPPPPPAAALVWEALNSDRLAVHRAKVPGGWLVAFGKAGSAGATFYPDPSHRWDGGSVS